MHGSSLEIYADYDDLTLMFKSIDLAGHFKYV